MSMQTKLTMMDMYRSFAGTKKAQRETELVIRMDDKKSVRTELEPDIKSDRKRKLPWSK